MLDIEHEKQNETYRKMLESNNGWRVQRKRNSFFYLESHNVCINVHFVLKVFNQPEVYNNIQKLWTETEKVSWK